MKREKLRVVTPPEPTHQTEIVGDQLIITYRVRKLWFVILWFLWGFILCTPVVYLFGYITVVLFLKSLGIISNNLSSPLGEVYPSFPILVIRIIFIISLGAEVMGLYGLLWRLAGKEIIKVNKEILVVTHDVLGWKRSKAFEKSFIGGFGISRPATNFSSIGRFGSLFGTTGTISFDYGAKAFQFGNELDEAEARQIIKKIQDHLKL